MLEAKLFGYVLVLIFVVVIRWGTLYCILSCNFAINARSGSAYPQLQCTVIAVVRGHDWQFALGLPSIMVSCHSQSESHQLYCGE